MKLLLLPLLLVASFAVGSQKESFGEYIKKSIDRFHHLKRGAHSFDESIKIELIAYDILKADIEECKKEYARDLLHVTDWELVYIGCLQLCRNSHSQYESSKLEIIEKDLIEFCNNARNAQEFLKQYATDKLNY